MVIQRYYFVPFSKLRYDTTWDDSNHSSIFLYTLFIRIYHILHTSLYTTDAVSTKKFTILFSTFTSVSYPSF